MRKYIIKRVLSMIPIFIGITLITFFVIYLTPGGPAQVWVSPRVSPGELARIESNLGLTEPVYIQYMNWFKRALILDFGRSFVSGRKVSEIVLEKLPITLLLTGTALTISLTVAIFFGVFSAARQHSKWDYIISVFAFAGQSIPSFWLGLMLILVFSLELGWLPSVGMYNLRADRITLLDRLRHMVLPVLCLALPRIASWTRYIRSSILEILCEDYILTARSKGLSEQIVLYKHALKNALIPLVTLVGLSLPTLLEGAFIVESIFGWPGMGFIGINAVWQRDYPVLMAINVIAAWAVLLSNFVTDLIYLTIDPRIDYR